MSAVAVNVWKSEAEKKGIVKTISTIQGLLSAHGFEDLHFLAGSSLLGYARNRTLLAWLDSSCVLVEARQKQRVEELFKRRLGPLGLTFSYFYKDNIHGLKVFPVKARYVPRTYFAFESVDVMWYDEVSSKIIEYRPILSTKEYSNGGQAMHRIPRIDVFPTTQVLMDSHRVMVPRNWPSVVSNLFGYNYLTTCESRRWDRRWDQWAGGTASQLTVPCRELTDMYTFHPH